MSRISDKPTSSLAYDSKGEFLVRGYEKEVDLYRITSNDRNNTLTSTQKGDTRTASGEIVQVAVTVSQNRGTIIAANTTSNKFDIWRWQCNQDDSFRHQVLPLNGLKGAGSGCAISQDAMFFALAGYNDWKSGFIKVYDTRNKVSIRIPIGDTRRPGKLKIARYGTKQVLVFSEFNRISQEKSRIRAYIFDSNYSGKFEYEEQNVITIARGFSNLEPEFDITSDALRISILCPRGYGNENDGEIHKYYTLRVTFTGVISYDQLHHSSADLVPQDLNEFTSLFPVCAIASARATNIFESFVGYAQIRFKSKKFKQDNNIPTSKAILYHSNNMRESQKVLKRDVRQACIRIIPHDTEPLTRCESRIAMATSDGEIFIDRHRRHRPAIRNENPHRRFPIEIPDIPIEDGFVELFIGLLLSPTRRIVFDLNFDFDVFNNEIENNADINEFIQAYNLIGIEQIIIPERISDPQNQQPDNWVLNVYHKQGNFREPLRIDPSQDYRNYKSYNSALYFMLNVISIFLGYDDGQTLVINNQDIVTIRELSVDNLIWYRRALKHCVALEEDPISYLKRTDIKR